MLKGFINQDRLLGSLKEHEGLRLKPYDDATGKELKKGDTLQGALTIGYGINLSCGISEFEAEMLLEHRAQKAILLANQHIDRFNMLTPQRQEVIVEMIFNLGIGGFLSFKNFLANIERGDFNKAAHELVWNSDGQRTKWARQVGKRADELAERFRNG